MPTGSFTPDNLNGKAFIAFPNPARNHTTILLKDLEQAGEAKAVICNLSGEPVCVLRAAVTAGAGKSLVWDCRNIAPGLYLVYLTLDGKQIGKGKVAVVR
jgi:hypothetical protein